MVKNGVLGILGGLKKLTHFYFLVYIYLRSIFFWSVGLYIFWV